MSDLIEKTATQESPFDALRLTREDGTEYWSARDLQGLLGYVEWRKVRGVIERAQLSALNVGAERARDQFVGAAKMVEVGSGAERQVDDFHLSRYAAYLVAMNGEPSKPEIAAAQHYFAVRTREAEVASKPKEIDYLSLEPAQLIEMGEALKVKANALRELAGVLEVLRASERRFAAALQGVPEVEHPQAGTDSLVERPVISSMGHTRVEQIHPWLTASNLRRSADGRWWQTTTREVCVGAMRRDPLGVTSSDQADAARALRALGWDKAEEPGVWQKRV